MVGARSLLVICSDRKTCYFPSVCRRPCYIHTGPPYFHFVCVFLSRNGEEEEEYIHFGVWKKRRRIGCSRRCQMPQRRGARIDWGASCFSLSLPFHWHSEWKEGRKKKKEKHFPVGLMLRRWSDDLAPSFSLDLYISPLFDKIPKSLSILLLLLLSFHHHTLQQLLLRHSIKSSGLHTIFCRWSG